MKRIRSLAECSCAECNKLRKQARTLTARGYVVAFDQGGHGFRLCRVFKKLTYGVDCYCYRHRKRLHKLVEYKEKKDASEL
jgi:hypothetical protein